MKICFASLLLVVIVLLPTRAHALSGPVLLGFGEGYVSAGGKTSTHRGVDVAMDAGAHVTCPSSGQVRFAGKVPGTAGGSVLAVTIDTDAGSVTMLPLQTLSVKAGETVGEGAAVGELAADGDISSSASHLHLGLKHGDLYVDPAGLLETAPAPTAESKPAEQPAAAPEPDPIAADDPQPIPSAMPVLVEPLPSPQTSLPSPSALVAGSKAVAAASPAMRVDSADAALSRVVLGRGVSLAPGTSGGHASVAGTAASRGLRATAPCSTRDSLHRVDPPTQRSVAGANSLFARTAGGVLAGAILLVALVVAARRTIARRVAMRPRVSDRFGIFVAAPANR